MEDDVGSEEPEVPFFSNKMVETRRFEQYAMILISTQYDLDSALIFIVHLVELTIILCVRVCDLGHRKVSVVCLNWCSY